MRWVQYGIQGTPVSACRIPFGGYSQHEARVSQPPDQDPFVGQMLRSKHTAKEHLDLHLSFQDGTKNPLEIRARLDRPSMNDGLLGTPKAPAETRKHSSCFYGTNSRRFLVPQQTAQVALADT